MEKELPWFDIEGTYGGNQDWLKDPMMHLGGCGALAACDLCIYLAKYYGETSLVPFSDEELDKLSKERYIEFSNIMKPYLHPRWKGINTLEAWMDGFQKYLDDRTAETGESPILCLRALHKGLRWPLAGDRIMEQLDKGIPLPIMILHHDDKQFHEYEWHWFILNGYRKNDEGFIDVKAVTYGEAEWLPLDKLWDTGRDLEDGGVVLIDLK